MPSATCNHANFVDEVDREALVKDETAAAGKVVCEKRHVRVAKNIGFGFFFLIDLSRPDSCQE